jgi:hypothetical protein
MSSLSHNEIQVRYEINRIYRSVWVLCQQLGGREQVWLCVWSTSRQWCGTTVSITDHRFLDLTRPGVPILLP